MKPSPQQKKQNYHHGDLKVALLDETARILRDEGEEALSLRRLAASLGVSRTAPYNHFKSKEALLCAVAQEGFVRLASTMKEVLSRSRDRTGREITLDYVKTYVQFAVKNPEYYDLMFGSKLWRSEGLTDSLVSSARGTLRGDVERMERWQQAGLVSTSLNSLRFTQVFWGTLHGISRLHIDGVYTDSASVAQLCESASEMLWQQMDPKKQNNA